MSLKSSIYYNIHTNHLGSSSWITDAGGNAAQHMQYLPYGEDFINQRSTGFDARNKFTGKEKDAETGFQYFGARYYNSDISVWLSVDPLADSLPNLSPYNYCHNNPVILIDPDGMLDEEVDMDGDVCPYDPNGWFDDYRTNKSDWEYFDENKNYYVNGTETKAQINYEEGGSYVIKSFVYKDEKYSAQFNTETGVFVGYKNSEGEYYSPKTSTMKQKVSAVDDYIEGPDSPVGKVLYDVSSSVNPLHGYTDLGLILVTGKDGRGDEYSGFEDRVAMPILKTALGIAIGGIIK